MPPVLLGLVFLGYYFFGNIYKSKITWTNINNVIVTIIFISQLSPEEETVWKASCMFKYDCVPTRPTHTQSCHITDISAGLTGVWM